MLTIQQAAKLSGIPIDSLRYYDKMGILSPKRGENGYRYYDERDLHLLSYVSVMKYANFTLSEIGKALDLMAREPSDACRREGNALFEEKIADLNQRIENYRQIVTLLKVIEPILSDDDPCTDKEQRIDALVKSLHESIQAQKGI